MGRLLFDFKKRGRGRGRVFLIVISSLLYRSTSREVLIKMLQVKREANLLFPVCAKPPFVMQSDGPEIDSTGKRSSGNVMDSGYASANNVLRGRSFLHTSGPRAVLHFTFSSFFLRFACLRRYDSDITLSSLFLYGCVYRFPSLYHISRKKHVFDRFKTTTFRGVSKRSN